MLKILNGKISLTRGDTAVITCTLYRPNSSKEEYVLEEGDSLTFTLRKEPKGMSQDGFLIQKIFSDNQIKLNPEDTSSLEYGDYVYDVQLTFASGDVNTVVTQNIFEICSEVT